MLTIKVESIPGSSILDCLIEMQSRAAQLDIQVTQKINGKIVLVFPHTNPYALNDRYVEACRLNRSVVA